MVKEAQVVFIDWELGYHRFQGYQAVETEVQVVTGSNTRCTNEVSNPNFHVPYTDETNGALVLLRPWCHPVRLSILPVGIVPVSSSWLHR